MLLYSVSSRARMVGDQGRRPPVSDLGLEETVAWRDQYLLSSNPQIRGDHGNDGIGYGVCGEKEGIWNFL